jgi:hypothetical protein
MIQCFFLWAWRAWNLGFGALEWGFGFGGLDWGFVRKFVGVREFRACVEVVGCWRISL